MLIVKFIMCLYVIVILSLTTACADKKDGHKGTEESTASAEASDQPGPAAKIAELNGVTANAIEIFSHSPASGDWRSSSAAFQIALPGPGTLIIISAGLESQTCSPDQFSASFTLFDINADGALAGMQPLALQQAHRIYEKKMYQLQADAMVKAHCTALSPAKFMFALKFIGQSPGSDIPSGTDPLPGPVPPSPPGPTPPLPPPPPAISCDNAVPPADSPKIYKAKIRLWTTASKADGCKNTFTWTIRDAVRPDPLSQCAFPEIKLDTPQQQFLKLSESFDQHSLQLAWFLLKSGTDATALAKALRAGETIDLTYEDDACLGADRHYVTISQPTDMLLFRQDARDFDACSSFTFAALTADAGTDGAGFLAEYDYRTANEEDFFYNASFNFTGAQALKAADKLRWSVFNRKTHAWVMPFADTDAAASGERLSGEISVTDPHALRRLLPQQEHLELVFRAKEASCDKSSARTQAVFDAGSLFLTAVGGDHFSDRANPGRSRFLLKESDLPQ